MIVRLIGHAGGTFTRSGLIETVVICRRDQSPGESRRASQSIWTKSDAVIGSVWWSASWRRASQSNCTKSDAVARVVGLDVVTGLVQGPASRSLRVALFSSSEGLPCSDWVMLMTSLCPELVWVTLIVSHDLVVVV